MVELTSIEKQISIGYPIEKYFPNGKNPHQNFGNYLKIVISEIGETIGWRKKERKKKERKILVL